MILTTPKNQTAEVLFQLLNKPFITRSNMFLSTGILNLTARIADLRIRHGINIVCEKETVKNKRGDSVTYGKWKLADTVDAQAKYSKINSEE